MAESPAPSGNYFELVNRVDRGVLVRIVTRGEDASLLPEDPEAIAGKVYSPIERVLFAGLLCVVSVAAVFLITVNAWDDEGFFPWFWNVVWVLFPWVFLTPAWSAYARSLRRQSRAGEFAAGFEEFRARAVRAGGTVTDVGVRVGENGRVNRMAVEIGYDWPHGTQERVVVAPRSVNLLQTEIPQVGAPAHVWISPDQRTRVVQIAAGAAVPGQSDVAESLAKLAELHASGALSDEEYQKAKQRLLG
ncbi:SHOCT domain-containing protein [Saccharopolyspora hirsuta]|uniref:SHOCT domain-containing protein n=1 Tax=Saccharopolyspora hirsuta TaxID=1837 RepID=UPI00333004AD